MAEGERKINVEERKNRRGTENNRRETDSQTDEKYDRNRKKRE